MSRSLLLTETTVLRGVACELPRPRGSEHCECMMLAHQVLWIKRSAVPKWAPGLRELVLGPVRRSPAGDLEHL